MYMYDCVQKKVGMRRGTIETIEKRPVEKYISLYVEKMKVREIAEKGSSIQTLKKRSGSACRPWVL